MISLKNRILISFSVSLCLFLIIFAVTLFFGFNLSLKDWNRANEEKYVKQITNVLENHYKKDNPAQINLTELLTPYVKDNMETVVFDRRGFILFSQNSEKGPGERLFSGRMMERINTAPGTLPPPRLNNGDIPGTLPPSGISPPPRLNNGDIPGTLPPPRLNNGDIPGTLPPPRLNNGDIPGTLPPPRLNNGDIPGTLPPPRLNNGDIPGTLPPPRLNNGDIPGTLPPPRLNNGDIPGTLPPPGQVYADRPGTLPPPGQGRDVGIMMGPQEFRHINMQNLKREDPGPGQAYLRPVIADREIKAFVRVKSLKLKFYSRANKKFINSIIITLIAGTLSALAIAMSSSFIISRKLTKDAASLAEGLNSLAGGQRDVVFPDKGSKEILSISESAEVLQKELIKDDNRRKQWAQDIAHDLRTPVTAVKAQIEAVIDGIFKPDHSRLKRILKELKRLEILVEDMNSLSKIESSENSLNISSVNSSDIKSILKERFEIFAEEKNIDLNIHTEDFYFKCDLHLLLRALSNLCQNSVKYSDPGSEVDITITESNDKALFTFENPGHIEESEIEKIFDRLYRGETGRSTQGSGLGLTIAAAVIRQHKGEIKAENIGNRVRFSVTVPLTLEQT